MNRPVSRLDFHLRLTLISVLGMGYLVLFAAEIYPLEYIPPVIAALLFGYMRFYHPEPPILPYRIWTIISLLVVACPIILSFTGHLFFLDALNIIFLVFPIIKLYTGKTERDYLQVFALAFGQIIYGTIVNSELSFGFALVAYLAATIWGLILISFRNAVNENRHQPGLLEKTEKAVFRRRYIFFVGMLGPISIFLTFLFFFIVPRHGSAIMNLSFGIAKRFSGFSDKVDIGEVGEIMLDESVAMRVTVDGAAPRRPIYWRGAVLDTFNGMTWSAFPLKPMKVHPSLYKSYFIMSQWPQKQLTHQTVFLDGIEANYLLHADFIANALVKSSELYLHANSAVTFPGRLRFIRRYEVWSYPQSSIKINDFILKRFLQLPVGLDPRIPELAKNLTKDIKDPFEKGRVLEEHLKDNYTYSLNAGLIPSSDPLPHFLFERKAGHCEYYATSMTIMLRTLGIPARLVTGYQEGEYNEIENYFIVRQSNAHAWVEANIGGRWLRFDPTPAASWQTYAVDIWSNIKHFADSMTFRWQRYVIAFTVRDQVKVLVNFDRRLNRISGKKLKEWIKTHKYAPTFLLLALLTVFLFLKGSRFILTLKKPAGDDAWRFEVSKHFWKLAKRLAKAGITRQASQTPSELISLAGDRYPYAKSPLRDWLKLYEPLRYARDEPSRNEFELLSKLEVAIAKALSRKEKIDA